MAEVLLARLDEVLALAGGTASNVGSVGTGVFKQKLVADFEFYKLNAASSKMSIALNGTDRIDFDVVEANLTLGNLAGTLSIAKGGTGQTTAAAARLAFGFPVALDTLWTAVSLAAGRLALGFPVALDAVWTAVSVAAARIALGFPAALDAVWTAVSVAAARIALGFPAALDALWTATSFSDARTALGLLIGTDVLAPGGSGAGLTGIRKQGKETIFVPASAMRSRTTNGAAAGSTELATNKNMEITLDFDTTTQEFAQFDVWMPKSWNLGTVTFQPAFSQLTTAAGGVVFGLAGVARSDAEDLDVAFGTAVTSTKTAGTLNKGYLGPESAAITIAGTPAAGDWVHFQINRTVADGSDTLAQDARLKGIRLHYTTNASDDT